MGECYAPATRVPFTRRPDRKETPLRGVPSAPRARTRPAGASERRESRTAAPSLPGLVSRLFPVPRASRRRGMSPGRRPTGPARTPKRALGVPDGGGGYTPWEILPALPSRGTSTLSSSHFIFFIFGDALSRRSRRRRGHGGRPGSCSETPGALQGRLSGRGRLNSRSRKRR